MNMNFFINIIIFMTSKCCDLTSDIYSNDVVISNPPEYTVMSVELKNTTMILKYFIVSCLIRNAQIQTGSRYIANNEDVIELIFADSFWEIINTLKALYENNKMPTGGSTIWKYLHINDKWFSQIGTIDFYTDLAFICQFAEIRRFSPLEFFAHVIYNTDGLRSFGKEIKNKNSTYVSAGLLPIFVDETLYEIGCMVNRPNYYINNKFSLCELEPIGLVGTYFYWIDYVLIYAKNIPFISYKMQKNDKIIFVVEDSIFFRTLSLLLPNYSVSYLNTAVIDDELKDLVLVFDYVIKFVYLRSDMNNSSCGIGKFK